MKTNYRIWLAIFPFTFITAACQYDEIAKHETLTTEGTITLHATMGSYSNQQSRAQVELGNDDKTREIFKWNEEDSFTLYDQEKPTISSAFTISGYSEDTPNAEATFTGKNNFTEDANVTAIYPEQTASAITADKEILLTLPEVAMTDGSEEDWKNYMSHSMYMYANTTLSGENIALTFNHLCAMIRVSYTNATNTEQNVSNITLTGSDKFFGTSTTFMFANNSTSVSASTASLTHAFTSLAIAPGRTIDFYFLFFPNEKVSTGTLTISINDKEVTMNLSDMLSENFASGKRYWFNTIETTNEGFIWEKDVPEILITNLPLIQLAEEENGVEFIKDENGFVNVSINKNLIEKITSLTPYKSEEIDNLNGLEYFTNLKTLHVQNMGLTTLDVSKLINLEELYCYGNPLGKLDVSANIKLAYLECTKTGLSQLDITHNPNLTTLYCGINQISELNISQNSKLEFLNVGEEIDGIYNPISSLDISNNLQLKTLIVSYCYNLTSLDVSKNTKLEELFYEYTPIVSLNTNSNALLRLLHCGNTQITNLDISQNTNLIELECQELNITELDLSNNQSLEILICNGCSQLSSLNIANNPSLLYLMCTGMRNITELDITNNPLLISLECLGTNIEELDLSNNPNLETLQCNNCKIPELDITNNPQLTYFACGNQNGINYDDIDMTLYLTSEQKQNLWDGKMEWESGNERVIPTIKE